MNNLRWCVVLFALVIAVLLVVFSESRSTTVHADSPALTSQPQPVEMDMHEFMEYVFQPTYKRLKSSMASEPADNVWKGIKSDALILA
jgi:hypothetical protein